jgi:multiple sugar transport system permease protein
MGNMKFKQALVFLIPSLAGLCIFYMIPFVGSLYYAFVSADAQSTWVGLGNFYALFKSNMFLIAAGNTLMFMLIIVPVTIAISLTFSLLAWNSKGMGGIFRSVMLTTYVMPTVAVMLLWTMLFNRAGTINFILGILGLQPVAWMDGSNMRWPVIFMFLWKNMGFNMIIILASLNAMSKEVYESSLLDGAGWIKRQIYIVIPEIIPALIFVAIISMVNSLRIFKEAYILVGPYPTDSVYTLQHYMYNQFKVLNYNYVVASSLLFVLAITIIVGVLFIYEHRIKG